MFVTRVGVFRKWNLCLFAALFALVLTACGSDSKRLGPEPEPPAQKPTTGVWSAPAYGVIADISETDSTFYQFTSQYCQIYPLADLLNLDFARLIESSEVNGDKLLTTLGGAKVPGIEMEKRGSLPQHCVDDLLASEGDENYEFSPQRDFEIFWLSFSELYAFFEIEGVDWAQVYEEAVLAVTSETTEEELFGVFAQMITPLMDFHVEIVNPKLGFEYVSPSRKMSVDIIALTDFLTINDIELPFSETQYYQFLEYLEFQKGSALSVILNEVAVGEEIHFNETQTMIWARLNDNMGYLLINTMDDTEIGGSEGIEANLSSLETTMDLVLTDLVGIEGLVVDVRYNEGGDDFVSQYIAGRLTNQSFNAYSKQSRSGDTRTTLQDIVIEPQGDSQFSGPVAVLASMTTASAAEAFTLAMRERMNSVIVGEATAGGFSDQLIKILPSGTMFTLSNEFYVSVSGEEFEGVGVPVDIQSDFFTLEQRESGRDLGLDAAVEWLLNF